MFKSSEADWSLEQKTQTVDHRQFSEKDPQICLMRILYCPILMKRPVNLKTFKYKSLSLRTPKNLSTLSNKESKNDVSQQTKCSKLQK